MSLEDTKGKFITKYKLLRILSLFIRLDGRFRSNILSVIFMEVPFSYLHEIGHFLAAFAFGLKPRIHVWHVLKVIYSHEHKNHSCYPYLMSVVYDTPYSKYVISSYIKSFIITIAPILFMMFLMVILCYFSVWYGIIFFILMVINISSWGLSMMDIYDILIIEDKIKTLTKTKQK